jgi:hypothetical protein
MVPSVHDLVQQNLTRWAFRLTEHNVENDGVEYLEFNIRFGHSPLKMRLMDGVLLPFSVHARVKDFLHGLLVRWCAR